MKVTDRTLELCRSVTRRPHGGALAPFLESASTSGEALASPGSFHRKGKKESEVNRCQTGEWDGVGVCVAIRLLSGAQAGPRTEDEGTGPLKGRMPACDWGGRGGREGQPAGAAAHQAQARSRRQEPPPSVCRTSLGLTLPGRTGSLKPPGAGMAPTGIPTGGDGGPPKLLPSPILWLWLSPVAMVWTRGVGADGGQA